MLGIIFSFQQGELRGKRVLKGLNIRTRRRGNRLGNHGERIREGK